MNTQFKINTIKRFITGMLIFAALFIIYFYCPFWVLTACAFLVNLWIICAEWPKLVSPRTKLFWILTPIYPIAPLIIIVLLLHSAYRPVIVCTILLVFAHDSAAYFVGSLWGKRLLAPTISPKKTWEGASAGFVMVYLLVKISSHLPAIKNWPVTLYLTNNFYSLVFALIISMLATTGDLFESWFKRKANLKDSGDLLPGHGGLLDKADGLLFVAPVIYLFLLFTQNY